MAHISRKYTFFSILIKEMSEKLKRCTADRTFAFHEVDLDLFPSTPCSTGLHQGVSLSSTGYGSKINQKQNIWNFLV